MSASTTLSPTDLNLKAKYFSGEYLEDKETIIIKATNAFIPEEVFRSTFETILEFVKNNKVSKIVFDKRELKAFHQQSMSWYHTEWKPQVFHHGVKHHRKILPADEIFQQSVKIGRAKIREENPGFQLEKYDIQYCESIEEALEK